MRSSNAFGTLDRVTLKRLDGLAGRARRRERNLKIGTVLVRDYQGLFCGTPIVQCRAVEVDQ
jgi:hypothetical protein